MKLADTNLGSRSDRFVEDERDISRADRFDFENFEQNAVKRLQALWLRRRIFPAVVACSLLLGIATSFLFHVEYESTAQLMPPDTQSSSTAMLAAVAAKAGPGVAGMAGDLLGLKTSGDLFVGILRSRTVQDRLVDRFDLKKVYGVRLEEDARKELRERTAVGSDRKSGIISITVTDRSAPRAASLATAYVEALDHLVAEVSSSSARRERIFLEERLKAVKADLDKASADFSQFASKNTAIDIKEQGRAMVEAAARVQGELIAAESELRGLKQIYAPNNVRVRATEARITELRSQLEKLGGSQDSSEKPEQGPYPSIRELPILGVTYADLYRRTRIEETVYETLTQEYELAKVQEAKETPTVKVLDEPVVPERKSFPPRTAIAVLFAFMGFCGATVWILGEASWRQLSSERPSKVFVSEVLNTVEAKMPWSSPNGSRFQAFTHGIWIRLFRRA